METPSDAELHRRTLDKHTWFTLEDTVLWLVAGADAERYLQGQLTNDVSLATADNALRAFLCTAKGQVEGQLFVHRAPSGQYRLTTAAAQAEDLLLRLDKYIIADDVEITDLSEEFSLFHALGPDSRVTVEALDIKDLQAIKTPRYRLEGYDLVVSKESADALRGQLGNNGPELTPAARETLRITQGIPAWETELQDGVLPAETGLLEETVNFTKGCYIGQEVISRMKSSGKVRRHLVGIEPVQGRGLQPGLDLYEPGAEGGKPLGKITSATRVPTSSPESEAQPRELALGFVKDGSQTPGTTLTATGPGETQDRTFINVQVIQLPVSSF